jgi:hypothetical protein
VNPDFLRQPCRVITNPLLLLSCGTGIFTAHGTHGTTRPLPRTRIRAGALTAHGQPARVPDTPITTNTGKTANVLRHFTVQVTFDNVFILEQVHDAAQFIVSKVVGLLARIDSGFLNDLRGPPRTDAINVPQRVFDSLVTGDIYT